MSTEHPEPLVHILPHLREKGRVSEKQPSGSEDASLRCDSWGSRWGLSPVAAGKKESPPSKGLQGTDVENRHIDTVGEGEVNWEMSIGIYALPCKQTVSGKAAAQHKELSSVLCDVTGSRRTKAGAEVKGIYTHT